MLSALMTEDDSQDDPPAEECGSSPWGEKKRKWPEGITRKQIIQLVRDKVIENTSSSREDGMQTAYLRAWLAREEPGSLVMHELAMNGYFLSLRKYCHRLALAHQYPRIEYADRASILNEVAAHSLQDDRTLESVYHYGGTMLWWQVHNHICKSINWDRKIIKTVSMTEEIQNSIADEGADPLTILEECEARTTGRMARLKTVPKPLRAIAEKLLRSEPITESDYQALLCSSSHKQLAKLVKELVDDHAGE